MEQRPKLMQDKVLDILTGNGKPPRVRGATRVIVNMLGEEGFTVQVNGRIVANSVIGTIKNAREIGNRRVEALRAAGKEAVLCVYLDNGQEDTSHV